MFPSLQKLDDEELPRLVTFDDEDSGPSNSNLLPIVNKMSIANEAINNAVLEFLKLYFDLYDGDSRQTLLAAYHDEAIMSFSSSLPPNFSLQLKGFNQLYRKESRNLLHVSSSEVRQRLLHTGKLDIVSFLEKFPKTQHDLNSFTIDITVSTDNMAIFTITGFFKERDNPANDENKPIRRFCRMFVLIRNGDGWNIVNESFYLTVPLHRELKMAFKEGGSQPQAPQQVDEATKNLRINQLGQKTNMNRNYCVMCLEQVNWSLDQAYEAFLNAQRENKLPLEAFEHV